MREKTSLLEFGVDSADCSVQSAGSLLGGGLPKLAMMSGGQPSVRHDEKWTTTQGDLLLREAMRPPRRQEGNRQSR